MKKQLPYKNRKKGFTLIETLVAIFVLLVSTTGPLTFAQSGLRSSFLARDQIVAFYLAQDAIETIKSMRDNSSIQGNDWLAGIPVQCFTAGQKCQIDTIGNVEVTTCSSGGCDPLRINNNNQFGVGGSGPASQYTRTLYLSEIVNDREAQIIVDVSWDTNFLSDRSIIVQENVYNWVPIFSQ